MSSEELIGTISGLEHALSAAWEWERLYTIGRSVNGLHPAEDRDALRLVRQDLTNSLVSSYVKSMELVDHALQGITRGPVADVLLERLCDHLLWITGEGSFREFWAHVDASHGYEPEEPLWEFVVGGEVITDPTAGDFAGNWSQVAKDVEYYGSKVVEHVRGYLAAPVSPTARTRPQWIGSASELAFLLTDLVEAGYLVPPPMGKKSGKDGNRAAIADAILNAFDIRKENGDPVSPDYFRSLMRPGSPDRNAFTKLFTIRPRTATK